MNEELASALEEANSLEVIFPDHRKRLTPPFTFPASSLFVLEIADSGDSKPNRLGTGWLASPTTIVTAGHSLFHGDAGSGTDGKCDHVFAYPANEYFSESKNHLISNNCNPHPVFMDSRSVDFDIGVVVLSESISNIPPLKFGSVDDQTIVDSHGSVVGYQWHDKTQQHFMMEAHGALIAVDEQRIWHQIDTDKGASGAPLLFSEEGSQSMVIGSQSQGLSTRPDGETVVNTATRINQNLAGWIRSFNSTGLA